jgi:hypothetical protein
MVAPIPIHGTEICLTTIEKSGAAGRKENHFYDFGSFARAHRNAD